MDDPWGSPWATNDSSSALEPFPRSSTTLEPPGRTLTRNRSFSAQSPWAADDDGFADWATADPGLALPPVAAAASTTGPGWSVWGAESAMMNTSQTYLPARAREGSLGQPSPTLWPAASSPGLQPTKSVSRRSSARSLGRQPSPDPWATEFSQNRLSLPAAVHNSSTDQLSFSALARHVEEPEHHETRPNEPVEAEPTAQPSTSNAVFPEKPVDDHATQIVADQEESEARGRHAENNSNSPTLSRHSSLSDDSHHDDRPPESPITSMDEDAKDRPTVTRRASAKIQELVHLYDGLAKKKDQTLLTPDATGGRPRSTSRSISIRSSRTDDGSDFGDFEDGHEEEAIRSSRQSSNTGSPRRPASRAGRLRSLSKTSLRASAVVPSQPAPSPILEEVSSKFNELREKFGPAKFDVNLDIVDALFDVEKLDREQPSFKDYSLDAIEGIIKDSFTVVSERKTWYRISRPGTLRKHDMGDHENYRRVTWTGSKVREDVTKIVRRWMEEDSYSGRPTMGRGLSAIKSGGFNWDAKSKTEPLSFDQIFGKRKSVQPVQPATTPLPRPLSLQPQPTVHGHSRNSSAGVKSLPPRSPLSIPEPPPGPAFGWSTGANDTSTPASSRPSSQYARPSLDVNSTRSGPSRAASVHEPESRSSLQLAPPPSGPTLVTSVEGLNPTLDTSDDEDEEWGDMVASPAVESRPASMLFDNSFNGSMSSLHAQFAEAPIPISDATTMLNAVASKLEEAQSTSIKEGPAASGPPSDIWDFSAFDSKLVAPAIPPTITSKPEFDFDTPLHSPTPSVPSRSGSPSSFPFPKPSTSSTPARAESPSLLQHPKPPTPSVPFRPQHGQNRSRSSLNLVRPSPLHNVIMPKVDSPIAASPIVAEKQTVSFAVDDDDEETEEEAVIVRQIVGGLPDLSYMLR